MSMTAEQVAQFKRSHLIEDVATNLYYAASMYHGYDWPLWVRGLWCADRDQHARQQQFRADALFMMDKAGLSQPPPVRQTLLRRFVTGWRLIDRAEGKP